jgi:molybdopterin converting factor small subunit
MPHVFLSGSTALAFTGGVAEFESEAASLRRLVREFDGRFPGLGEVLDEAMAVAVDGAIFQDAHDLPFEPGSEVVFIPKIGGG